MTDYVVAMTTIDSDERARQLARELVERRLVACVNIVPNVTSVYRWQGAIEEETEYLLVMKTRADRVEALERSVEALHPYDVPELVALSVERGAPSYLEWVGASVSAELDAKG